MPQHLPDDVTSLPFDEVAKDTVRLTRLAIQMLTVVWGEDTLDGRAVLVVGNKDLSPGLSGEARAMMITASIAREAISYCADNQTSIGEALQYVASRMNVQMEEDGYGDT